MRNIAMTALAAALVAATPAAAKNNTPDQAAPTAGASGKATDAEKKICKRLATSGTRMAERVCLTKEQWKKVDELDS
jgi:Spy/CpxP family protein refolding chaperone